MDLIHPHDAGAVCQALREASATGTRVLPVGGRQHLDRGNPSPIDAELWMTLLNGIEAYNPAEMLVVVRAGSRVVARLRPDQEVGVGGLGQRLHERREQRRRHLAGAAGAVGERSELDRGHVAIMAKRAGRVCTCSIRS